SIGLTLLHQGVEDADRLLYHTDLAMQQVKANGGGGCEFYNANIQNEVERRMQLEQDLTRAVGTPQLWMAVQPQFDRDGATVGAELLMRWQHPTQGAVPPDVFIPLAEEVDLIHKLTYWSIDVACESAIALQNWGLPYTLSVN